MAHARLLALAAGLTLALPAAARSSSLYQLQPLLKLGDKVGALQLDPNGHFDVGGLNDNGQIVFAADSAIGGQLLIQYSGGTFIPIVVPGADAPGGKWSATDKIVTPVGMNQLGNVVFGADVLVGGKPDIGTFFWDSKAQIVTAVALRGMPAVDNRVFAQGANSSAAINNENDIAFSPLINNAAGEPKQGVFLLGRDGKLQPIALPDQDRPGGGKFASAGCPYLNDAGVIGFAGRQAGEKGPSSWVWDKGTISPVAVLGSDAPGGGKIGGSDGALVNNKNQSLLADVQVNDPTGPNALYRDTASGLAALIVPGTKMPDGGTFQSIPVNREGISTANDAGQHAFLATLADGSTAAYLLDADGKITLVLKSSDLGPNSSVGQGHGRSIGVGLNNRGQVALTVQIAGGPDTLVVLTPAAP